MIIRVAAATAAALMAWLPPALAQQAEPGDQWEVTTEMQMPGMGMSMPARTQKVCSPRNASEPAGVPEPEDSECESYDVERSGTTTRWKMRCTGKQPVTGTGEITYQGRDAYTGQMTMNMDGQSMTTKMSGKRVGECDAGAIKRQVAAAEKQTADYQAQQCRGAVDSMQVMMFDGSFPSNCDAKVKAQFCQRLATEEGFDLVAVRDRNPMTNKTDLESAATTCGVDATATRKKLCGNAMSGGSLLFAARHCPDEAAPLAQKQCAGRTFTSPPAEQYREFCNAYARHGLMQGAAPAAGQEAPATPPAQQDSAIEQGKKALKKLLPF